MNFFNFCSFYINIHYFIHKTVNFSLWSFHQWFVNIVSLFWELYLALLVLSFLGVFALEFILVMSCVWQVQSNCVCYVISLLLKCNLTQQNLGDIIYYFLIFTVAEERCALSLITVSKSSSIFVTWLLWRSSCLCYSAVCSDVSRYWLCIYSDWDLVNFLNVLIHALTIPSEGSAIICYFVYSLF